ncbi:hypothetical protein K1719_008946 [Acacia pycnantha]|nr:hypothetical protein K1719_008946 [Acacia pycnantha]
MGLLETQLLVGVFLSVVAIGISAFYLYSSWKKNTELLLLEFSDCDLFLWYQESSSTHSGEAQRSALIASASPTRATGSTISTPTTT